MSLGPLFVVLGGGVTLVVAYAVRLATKSTDVQWTRNPEGFNYYKDKNAKLLNLGPLDSSHSADRLSKGTPVDHAKLGAAIPDYRKQV